MYSKLMETIYMSKEVSFKNRDRFIQLGIAIASLRKLLREDKKISQTKLAEDLFIGRSTMSEYENGTKQPPISVLVKIADYFDVSLDYIAGRTDKKVSIEKINTILSTQYGKTLLNDFCNLQKDEKKAIEILIQTYKKYNK